MREHDQWTARLSEYLDGELGDAEREALERHLAGCAECAATLDDLRAVVVRATDHAPAGDLWPGVAARIAPAPARPVPVDLAERRRWRDRRISFSLPQLAAAGVALVLATGGVARLIRGGDTAPTASRPAAGVVVAAAAFSGSGTDSAVAQLERALDAGRGRLDTATVRVIEQNLKIIDQAIVQARRALSADPANIYLNTHLAQTMRRKVDLLRQATALVGARS
jgi:anti-sigma factor RsiW